MTNRIRTVLLIFFIGMICNAQIVNIPDANFKAALINTICADLDDDGTLESDVDTNNDGEIQVSEALAVHVLFYVPPPPFLPNAMAQQSVPENIADLTGIEAFINLKKLDISGNLLTTLNVSMLNKLNTLRCGSNDLTNLTLGNIPLEYLYCESNELTSLDVSGITELKFLGCNINFIQSLDVSGLSQLYFLSCYRNEITNLTFSGNTALTTMYCGNNLFTTLDLTSTSVSLLYCNDSPDLEQVFLKNGIISPFETPQFPFPIATFSFANTPNLEFICGDDDELDAITQSLNGQAVNVVSYCSFTPGGAFNAITGNIVLGCSGESTAAPQIKFGMNDGTNSGITFSDVDGHFTFFVADVTATITPMLENPEYFSVSPETFPIDFDSLGNTFPVDFCIEPNGMHPDLKITLIPLTPARPGFDATYKIHYENKGTETHSGEIALVFEDDLTDFISANPAISEQTTNVLQWTFSNLAPFESREITFTLNVNSPTEIPAVNNGDILHFTASADIGTDETPGDNMFEFAQTVVGSFDPNDKVVSRETIYLSELDDYLHYTIRFQNSGSFMAENVVVKDILSDNLEITTLQMVSASHPYRSTLTQGNKLEFFFEGINLPAETDNETASHGFVTFRIKPKNDLVLDDVIENSAAIYFDFNFPIITDPVTTTVTALQNPAFSQNDFVIYPNPVKNIFSIESNAQIKKIGIYNTLGQLVKIVSDIENQIDISDLNSGTYVIRLESDKGKTTKKLVKI